MLACSALQISLLFVAGMNNTTYLMAGFGVLGLVTAVGLFRGWRWLAYLVFIPVMAVAIWAMALAMNATGLSVVWYGGIALLDGLCWLLLFMALWRHPSG